LFFSLAAEGIFLVIKIRPNVYIYRFPNFNYMLNLIKQFPNHIQEAIGIFEATTFTEKQDIQNIVITGLGGSGIGGTIAAELCSDQIKVPVLVNKGYHLPAFVGPNTLVLVCSYSGNTEETLLALNQALESKAQISAITSGGILEELAARHNFDHVVIPGGNPPRSMLAYSLSILLLVLEKYNFVNLYAKNNLLAASLLLQNEVDSIALNAKELAAKTKNNVPVTYATSGFAGVATRWRQQFNENAKLPGWDAEVPEMNHNELVGWAGGNNSFVVYFLRSTDDFYRNQKRVEISSEIIQKHVAQVYDIWTQGVSKIEQAFYLIHLGDWISYYLSEERKVDIFDIDVIDHLKSELSKI